MSTSRLVLLSEHRPDAAEKEIVAALRRTRGNVRKAAELLEVSYVTLYKVINKKKGKYKEQILAARLGEL